MIKSDPIKIKMEDGHTMFLSEGKKIKGSSEIFLSSNPYGKTRDQILDIFDKLNSREKVCLIARNIEKYKIQFKEITGFELRAEPMINDKHGYILYIK